MKSDHPTPPDFYTGAPLIPEDLWFREEFISLLHEELRTAHVILSAPRRTGKTSVMDFLAERPPAGYLTLSVFVQDIEHPADFILLLLDLFHSKHPKPFRALFQKTGSLIGKALAKVADIEAHGFKLTFRGQDAAWRDHWRQYGDEFFAAARSGQHPILLLVDEFPDMILNLHKHHPETVRPFLAWFRGHRLSPHPKKDKVRWLLCGSVNLSSTLDALNCLDEINDLTDVPLPPLTQEQVVEFVHGMLEQRGVTFDGEIPSHVAAKIGRPIPVFLQMVTQDLYRIWKRRGTGLVLADVEAAFDDLVVASGARDKLQHYYSRIEQYYRPPKRAAAYALLAVISTSGSAVSRKALLDEFVRVLISEGDQSPTDKRKQLFNQLMRDLENDFYVVECEGESFDFASGLIKEWWRKYYA